MVINLSIRSPHSNMEPFKWYVSLFLEIGHPSPPRRANNIGACTLVMLICADPMIRIPPPLHYITLEWPIYTTIGDACVCVCVCKIGPISARTLSFRHETSRKLFSHSNFPIPYLWTAFCVPLSFVFYEKQ